MQKYEVPWAGRTENLAITHANSNWSLKGARQPQTTKITSCLYHSLFPPFLLSKPPFCLKLQSTEYKGTFQQRFFLSLENETTWLRYAGHLFTSLVGAGSLMSCRNSHQCNVEKPWECLRMVSSTFNLLSSLHSIIQRRDAKPGWQLTPVSSALQRLGLEEC